MFTLFVVPAFYTRLAHDRTRPAEAAAADPHASPHHA
jgi:hypothetical protein